MLSQDAGVVIHICPDNQRSKELAVYLLPKDQLKIAIYNSENTSFAAALSITGNNKWALMSFQVFFHIYNLHI